MLQQTRRDLLGEPCHRASVQPCRSPVARKARAEVLTRSMLQAAVTRAASSTGAEDCSGGRSTSAAVTPVAALCGSEQTDGRGGWEECGQRRNALAGLCMSTRKRQQKGRAGLEVAVLHMCVC